MAIIINNDGNKVVANIAERDAITNKFIGMEVTVNDATGDATLGGGTATYKWITIGLAETWFLIYSSVTGTINFANESKVITLGKVTADNVPLNGTVWNAKIVNVDGVIVGDVNPAVTLAEIDTGLLDQDGNTLEFSYAYGSFTAQLGQVLEDLNDLYLDLPAQEIDLSLATVFGKTISANSSFTFINPKPAGEVDSFILELVDGGSFTITWPSTVEWEGGVAPSLTVGGKDVLSFYTHDGGLTWRGLIVGLDMVVETVATVAN